jgi:hypothetical protein
MLSLIRGHASSAVRRDARRGEWAGLPAQRGREGPLSIERGRRGIGELLKLAGARRLAMLKKRLGGNLDIANAFIEGR